MKFGQVVFTSEWSSELTHPPSIQLQDELAEIPSELLADYGSRMVRDVIHEVTQSPASQPAEPPQLRTPSTDDVGRINGLLVWRSHATGRLLPGVECNSQFPVDFI